jgi:uncharacterized protein (DUF2147 family)
MRALRLKATLTSMLTAALVAVALPAAAMADVVGVWWTPKRDGKIEIIRDASGALTGRIIAGRPEDANKRDDQNPDDSLRRRRILGLIMLQGFKLGTDGKWTGGSLYDPESGSTYSSTIWLGGQDLLMLRGFVGISLLGRTETLVRVGGPQPHSAQAGEPTLAHLPR